MRRRPVLLAPVLALLLCGSASAEFVGHGGPVKGVAIAADGKEMVSTSFDYSVIRWSLETGAALDVLYGHDAAVNAVALLPGGFVTASDDGTLALWRPGAAEPAAKLTGHGGRIATIAVSPDGRTIASGAWDRTVRLWDAASGTALRTLEGHRGNVNGVAFTADGRRLVSASADGTLRLWRVADGTQLAEMGGGPVPLNGLVLLPGGRAAVAGADGTVTLWTLDTGERSGVLRAKVPVALLTIGASRDGTLVAAAGIDGALNIWRVADGTLLHRLAGDRGPLWSIAFSPDGKTVFAGGNDRMIRHWDVETGREYDSPVPVRTVTADPGTEGDDLGAKVWKRCIACHTLTADGGNRAGPTLHNIFGRRIGTVPGYPYSPALRNGDIVWTEETVAKLFELGPDVVTPGTKMPIQTIPNAEERAALVAFLREQAMD